MYGFNNRRVKVASRHSVIAREGWLYLVLVGLASVLCAVFVSVYLALPLLLLLAALFYFYRDPPRKIPALPLAVVCPVDGYVTNIEHARDPWLDRDAQKITIHMSRNGVFSIRSPIEGKLLDQWSPDVVAGYHASWIQSDEKDDVSWGIETRGARGPECYVQPGERIGQGQRCGFFIPGSSADVFVPLNARIEVNEKQQVLAGETVLASLVHNQAASIMVDEPTPAV